MEVLVIDDDPVFGKMLSLHLTNDGHNVSVCEDGIQGQRMARQLQPDVIIIDYQMPAANGAVVAQRIASSTETQHIPMILLSGTPFETVPRTIEEAGISTILYKVTLSQTELADALAEAVKEDAESVGHEFLFRGGG